MFFKVIISADQLLVLIDHSLGSIMKWPYNKLLINLIRSVITGKSQTSALINIDLNIAQSIHQIKASGL